MDRPLPHWTEIIATSHGRANMPPRYPNDTIRLLFSCMACNTQDMTTIRMDYAGKRAEVACYACHHTYITRITFADKQISVYLKYQRKHRRHSRAARPEVLPGFYYCEDCQAVHRIRDRSGVGERLGRVARRRVEMLEEIERVRREEAELDALEEIEEGARSYEEREEVEEEGRLGGFPF